LTSYCDYLFTGGQLIDGSGEDARFADVAIKGEKIVAIGIGLSQSYVAGTTFDITGSVISPGFIDLHTHSDLTALINPRMESSIHQGVTTEMVGNCGMSVGLMRSSPQFEVERRFTERAGVNIDWADIGSFARRVEASGIAKQNPQSSVCTILFATILQSLC